MAKLNDLFTVDYGNGFDLNKLIPEKKGIAVVTRTSKCNGISAYVARYKGVEPNAAGKITVALGGSVLSTHLQPEPFYTCQNVAVLTPKFEMSDQEKLFYCKCIRVNAYRYC